MNDLQTSAQPLPQKGETATREEHQNALKLLLKEFDRVCRELQIPYFLFAGTLLGAVRHEGFIPWDDDLDVIMLRGDYERFFREAPAILNRERFFLQEEFSPHWPMFFSKLRLNGTACLEKYYPKDPQSHQGVYMDIFPCDNGYSGELGRRVQFLCSKVVIAQGLYKRGYETDSFLKKVFMQLCRCLPGGICRRIVRGPKETGQYVHSFLGGASRFSKSVYPGECFLQARQLPFEDGVYPVPAGYDTLLRILYGDYRRIPSEEERSCKVHTVLVDLTRSYAEYENYRDGMKFDVQIRSIR